MEKAALPNVYYSSTIEDLLRKASTRGPHLSCSNAISTGSIENILEDTQNSSSEQNRNLHTICVDFDAHHVNEDDSSDDRYFFIGNAVYIYMATARCEDCYVSIGMEIPSDINMHSNAVEMESTCSPHLFPHAKRQLDGEMILHKHTT